MSGKEGEVNIKGRGDRRRRRRSVNWSVGESQQADAEGEKDRGY